MSTVAKSSTRDAYDPSRKWGLLPVAGLNPAASKTSASLGGGTTYVTPGVVISSQRDKALSEVMGRERHDRKRRQTEKEAQERELARLLEKDGGKTGGAKAVTMARQALAAKRTPVESKRKGMVTTSEDILAAIELKGSDSRSSRRVFSATAVKRIGFDPSAKPGSSERRHDNDRVVRISLCISGTMPCDFILQHPTHLEPNPGKSDRREDGV
jgi:minichromosome maintenance protein 10